MYSVLLAEDEMLVRLGLKNSIDWAQHNMEVVADVENGKDALERFNLLRPNIIMTDIRMHEIDGLELIKQIRAVDDNCIIIVVSCLDDFDLLREIMQYNVLGYILKASMTMDEVNSLLEKAKLTLDRLDSSLKIDETHIANIAQIAHMRNKEDYLRNYLFTENEQYLVSFREAFCGATCGVTCGADKEDMTPKALLLIHFVLSEDQEIKPLAFTSAGDILLNQFPDNLVISLNGDSYLMVSESEIDVNDRRFQTISTLILNYMDTQLSILIKSVSGNLCDLPKQFHTLYNLYRFTDEPMKPQIIDISHVDIDEYIKLNLNFIKETLLPLPINEQKESLLLVDNIYKNQDNAFEILQGALITFIKTILKNSLDQTKELEITRRMFNSQNLYEAKKIYLYSLKSEETAPVDLSHINDSAIRHAIQYMYENYNKDLSLSDVALQVNLSVNYFSTRFKQEVSESYVNCLNDIRISVAKKLLETTNDFFYEISEQVGYNSFEHFSRIFKQKTGFSLGEWRRLNKK